MSHSWKDFTFLAHFDSKSRNDIKSQHFDIHHINEMETQNYE